MTNQIIFILSIVFAGLILFYTVRDNNTLTSNVYVYIFFVIVPLIFAFSFAIDKASLLNNYTITLAMVLFIIFFILFFPRFLIPNAFIPDSILSIIIQYLASIILFFIVVIGLAIFYKMFKNYLLKAGGYSRIVVLSIFFIPCLITDFINFILEQLKITPIVTYVLLVIELVLIISFYLISKYFSFDLFKYKSIEILKNKQFLDTETELQLAGFDILSGNDIERQEFRVNYCLSMWIFVNTPELNDYIFPIFCYGNIEHPKPMITYKYDKKLKEHVHCFHFSNSIDTIVKLVLPNQRWNNFVFNYSGSKVDLFINGILERSVNLSHDIPIYEIGDVMTTGSNISGINGAISNINYYTNTLSAYQILGLYRLGINTIDVNSV